MGLTPEVAGLADLVEIGRGGFGVVYQAVERELGRLVAVKVLYGLVDAGAMRRFERERLAMGKLSGHPNVVTVYRAGLTDRHVPYIVMELMAGGSLRDRLVRDGTMPWRDAVEVTGLVASALEMAHGAGVHHRDIKPGNILVSSHGAPKLADFGIATLTGAPETRSATVTASLAHAAPEVVAGRGADARSDIYSLGSTLFELLHGRAAFARAGDDSLVPLLARIANDDVPDLRGAGVSASLCEIVEQAMSKDPAARPASATEVKDRLQRLLSGHAAGAARSRPASRAPADATTAPVGGQVAHGADVVARPAGATPEATLERTPTQRRPLPGATTRLRSPRPRRPNGLGRRVLARRRPAWSLLKIVIALGAVSVCLILIALGAVAAFVLDVDVRFVNVAGVGYVLIACGLLGLLVSALIYSRRGR